MTEALADRASTRFRLALMVAAGAAARLSPARLLRAGVPFSVPDRLLVGPEDLVGGDAARGAALYAGTYAFAGATVETGGRPVFALPPPSPEWARSLHEFSWLADLAAAGTALAAAHARSLIDQWNAIGRTHAAAQETGARRLLNWLVHAKFLLEGADPAFERRFMRAVSVQAGRLRRDLRRMPFGLPRLTGAIALAHAGLCLPDGTRHLAAAAARLGPDLRSLVLPDGGIATRNPADLLATARDLLPLRAAYAARGLAAPRDLHAALDRLLPMLRFFRHGDGTLALFNGMGTTPMSLLEAVLARDDAQGQPVLDARFSGYQRLEGGATCVVMDTGRPPPLALSAEAHAGTLSFEFSFGAARIVVNCGAPSDFHPARRLAARKTAAHSTVSVGEASSARFLAGGFFNAMLGPLIREGPRHVPVVRDESAAGVRIRASHDGYAARFGLIHERTLVLDPLGARVDGLDVLRPVRRKTGADVVLAWHLHPDVRARVIEDGRGVLLVVPEGGYWLFSAGDQIAALEESIFFAAEGGARRSQQIVVRLGVKSGARVGWAFARSPGPATPQIPDLS